MLPFQMLPLCKVTDTGEYCVTVSTVPKIKTNPLKKKTHWQP